MESLLSTYGILEWVHLNGKKLEVAKNVSNILIILYFISYTLNRKAVFITAFLFVEFIGNLVFLDVLLGYQYYLVYVLCYSLCYWVVHKKTKALKIYLGYVILVLFELTMSYNEWMRPEIETFTYLYYEYIVMAIHIFIISSITDKRNISRIARGAFDCVRNKFSASYSLSFFCYTLH